MPTTQTITPDGTVSNSPAWTLSGAATVHQAVANGSYTSSYIETTSHGRKAIVDLSSYTLAANEKCYRVRAGGLIGGESATGEIALKSGATEGSPYQRDMPPTFSFPGSTAYAYGAWATTPPDGGVWDQTKINALQLALNSYVGAGGNPQVNIYEARAQLDIHTQPSATISSPTHNQVMPSLPVSVGWTYSGDGDVQKKYQVKVFTKATVEGGGFNVNSSPTVFDSGSVLASDASVVTSGLDYGGEYYAYVKVTKDHNGADWDSEWSAGRLFKVNARPTATVNAPSGAISNTSKPTVTWTYNDAEGDTQSHYRVKVFEQPGGGWSGFDPETATGAVWDSGEVASSATSVQVGNSLPNTKSYRAYVKVKQSSPGVINSLWAFSTFNTAYSTASVPTVVVTAFDHYNRVVVTKGGTSTPAADWLVAERSLDGGVTWAPFRFGTLELSDNLSIAGSPHTLLDYEVPLGKAVQYRAYSVTTASGSEVASAPSSTGTGTTTGKYVWLKNPDDSSQNYRGISETDWLALSRYRARTAFRPVGRNLPLVIRGTGRGVTMPVDFLVLGDDSAQDLWDLIYSDKTLYLQTPKGSWYVEISGDVTEKDYLWDSLKGETPARKITIPFIEVDF